MKFTRKTSPAEIEAALEVAVHDLKALENLARQCTPGQLFATVLPWCAQRRTEVEDILGNEKAVTHIEISDDDPAKAYAAGRVKFSANPAVGVRIMGRLLKSL